MAGERRPQPPKAHRGPSRPSGLRQAVVGCVLFGAGVVVGALLWPLAKPKTPASRPPPQATARAPETSSAKKAPKGKAAARKSTKADQLTFFQTLKEPPAQARQNFVPFKPRDDVPPPLEALAPKEAGFEASEAPLSSVEEPDRQASLKAPSRYYIHVAAFQYGENAHRLTRELRRQGYSAYAIDTKGRRKPHRVRVGPYESRREADVVSHRLQKTLLYPTKVLKETKP